MVSSGSTSLNVSSMPIQVYVSSIPTKNGNAKPTAKLPIVNLFGEVSIYSSLLLHPKVMRLHKPLRRGCPQIRSHKYPGNHCPEFARSSCASPPERAPKITKIGFAEYLIMRYYLV
jgi:hypothetical protein